MVYKVEGRRLNADKNGGPQGVEAGRQRSCVVRRPFALRRSLSYRGVRADILEGVSLCRARHSVTHPMPRCWGSGIEPSTWSAGRREKRWTPGGLGLCTAGPSPSCLSAELVQTLKGGDSPYPQGCECNLCISAVGKTDLSVSRSRALTQKQPWESVCPGAP